MKPPEFQGVFWLPGHEDKQVSGRCGTNAEGRIELEILGTFSGMPMDNAAVQVTRILGISHTGKPVTLDNCFYMNRNFNLPGLTVSRIHVNRMYIGAHFDKDESIAFDAIAFHSEALDEWMHLNPINVQITLSPHASATISYAPLDVPEWQLTSGEKLKTNFAWTVPAPDNVHEAKITQAVWLEFGFCEYRATEDCLSPVWRLLELASFACSKHIPIDAICGYRSDLTRPCGEGIKRVPVDIYFKNGPEASVDLKDLSPPSILIPYGLIAERFPEVLSLWFESYDTYSSSFNLYFATRGSRDLYLDNVFLMLAQAAESFHRKMSSETTYSARDYAELSKTLCEAAPKQFKEWLDARLKYGNEPSLRKRLKDLFKSADFLLGDKKTSKGLLNSIVATRHYLTHYDENLKGEAKTGQDLWKLCLVLELLLEVQFCKLLGINDEEIEKIFNVSQAAIRKINEIKQGTAYHV